MRSGRPDHRADCQRPIERDEAPLTGDRQREQVDIGHANRLTIWTQWMDTTLLAPAPYRQVMLTIPKRLRAYCLYRRRLLGEIAHDTARLMEAFRRPALRLFVRLELFDEEQAAGMMTWPPSGSYVHTAA